MLVLKSTYNKAVNDLTKSLGKLVNENAELKAEIEALRSRLPKTFGLDESLPMYFDESAMIVHSVERSNTVAKTPGDWTTVICFNLVTDPPGHEIRELFYQISPNQHNELVAHFKQKKDARK